MIQSGALFVRGTFDPHVATKHLKDHEEERNEAD